jgi:tRNA/tmRNA/rRNA uracil-C5-methylase (TrmA/RlmC/RlmD family)
MKKGQMYEGMVERVDFPNKGRVRSGEETCTVKYVLPGQKISFRVNKTRNGKAEACLLEVLEKSPQETRQPCSHFGMCGGCAYLSLPYEEQLRIKEDQVKTLLDRALAGQTQTWTWEGIKGSPQITGYRNKMEFSFGDDQMDGPLTLGLHKRGSFYDVIDLKDCQIIDEDYQLILDSVGAYFRERHVPYYHKRHQSGYLRHLLVRKAAKTGEILIGLVTTSQVFEQKKKAAVSIKITEGIAEDRELCNEVLSQEDGTEQQRSQVRDKNDLTEWMVGFRQILLNLEKEGKLRGKIAGILHILNDSPADVVQSQQTIVLYGKESFREELMGLHFEVSVFSFFQTNTYGAEVLYQTVREYAAQQNRLHTIYDLYSGTGTITQLMSPVADSVVGVELVEEAVEAAKFSTSRNGLTNCRFIAGDVLKVLDELTEKPDLIILDPPRDGIHPKALPKILGYQVPKIIYVSCKPTSLARDLEAFLANGYKVEKAVAVDQFPWTNSVETVALLTKSFFR